MHGLLAIVAVVALTAKARNLPRGAPRRASNIGDIAGYHCQGGWIISFFMGPFAWNHYFAKFDKQESQIKQ
jgi:hypothetical protein